MARRSIRRTSQAVAAAWFLVGVVASCATTVARPPSSSPARASGSSLRVLQVNLCDSGLASCYTDRAVGAAAAVIRTRRPDVVTANEVCRHDVSELKRAMSEIHRGGVIASAFRAAEDRRTNGPYRCRDGEPYGIGVLAALGGSSSPYSAYAARYPYQDLADPEERVWVCIHALGRFYACTTHAASTSATVALAQCRYLLRVALPTLRRRHGGDPAVVGADLNLPAGGPRGAQSCPTAGYQRADDGSRQDVIAGPGAAVSPGDVIDMHGTTDHPGLLVDVDLPDRS